MRVSENLTQKNKYTNIPLALVFFLRKKVIDFARFSFSKKKVSEGKERKKEHIHMTASKWDSIFSFSAFFYKFIIYALMKRKTFLCNFFFELKRTLPMWFFSIYRKKSSFQLTNSLLCKFPLFSTFFIKNSVYCIWLTFFVCIKMEKEN